MKLGLIRIPTRIKRRLLHKALLVRRTPLALIFPDTWKVFYDREKRRDPGIIGWGPLLWLTIILGEVAYAVVHTAMNGVPLRLGFYP